MRAPPRWPGASPGSRPSIRTRSRRPRICPPALPPTRAPAGLSRRAADPVYWPASPSLDAGAVHRVQADAVRVLPWTANDRAHFLRLLAWAVDGVTTHYPHSVGEAFRPGGVPFCRNDPT